MNKKLFLVSVALLVCLGLIIQFKDVLSFKTIKEVMLGSQVSSDDVQVEYIFGGIDFPTERPGAASSSTGYELGHLEFTGTTAITVATTSAGFAITMRGTGYVKECSFDLQVAPTTGTISLMIQKNGTLITTKYCHLPINETFATQGGNDDISTEEILDSGEVTFVAGDRIGIIASSSNLNAATIDGAVELIIQLDN